jgi:hypothetical protein
MRILALNWDLTVDSGLTEKISLNLPIHLLFKKSIDSQINSPPKP